MSADDHIKNAIAILASLGLPRAQQNQRSGLCLLALLNLSPGKAWANAKNPLMGITPIMDWIQQYYGKSYAPNTREMFRRKTMHQFVEAGIALYNPDKPNRPVNSPAAVYQIESGALKLLRSFGKRSWHNNLISYVAGLQTLSARYAHERNKIWYRCKLRRVRRSLSVPASTVNSFAPSLKISQLVSCQAEFLSMLAIPATSGDISMLCCLKN